MAEEYIKRCTRYARTEMREIQPARFDPWSKHPSARKILLDPAGKTQDSAQFTKLIAKAEEESRDLVFLIGGADGLPAELARSRRSSALSLRPDLPARIGPRNPGRTTLPRLHHSAGPPLSAVK